MIVPDEKAQELGCPLSIQAGHVIIRRCQGRACMAWRGVEVAGGVGSGGYCGMAGAPAGVLLEVQRQAMGELMERQAAQAREAQERMLAALAGGVQQ